ncbi:cellulose synthase catalytic subunit [UDP-forming] [Trichoderma asperellum]|uniref:Cellulose synthase catalytic subunit [UDP-forming] n=1 Tax=Trichoderma asperellum TaxID=101201 RepID=A0A6V8QVF5_TRIAP|nr:cellulose synthase catalytic subunit [UDP-forming] [Trichoderma asperellum]
MMQSHQEEYEEMVEIGSFRHHQHTASDDSHPRLLNDNMRSNRSSRVNPDDFASPQWPPSIAGTGSSPSLTLRSGATTPYDHMSSSKHLIFADSRSSTPMTGRSPSKEVSSSDSDDQNGIAILHDRDDADIWKGWKRHLYTLTPLLTVLNTGIYLTYLGLRIACVILAQKASGLTFAAAWVFIAVELAVAVPSLMHNTWTMWSLKKRNRPKMRLTGNDVPTVDAFITCCGEDDELVMDTVRGACDQDYPIDKFRVIVLDDAKSAGLERSCAILSHTYPNLYYMARTKIPGQPHHFKAGNLNYGLEQSNLLPGGAGQFMAALDADMIPERDWLRALLPHAVMDPKMALVCPPQLFYNTPPSDPLAQSLDFFVHVIEPIKDAMGVAWCTGSGYVARREALEQIGNFPLGSLAEDVATSTLMLGKGWKTAYVHEPLQFGTVPEDYGSHLKQRTRWAIGTVDTSFKLNFCLWGEKVREMTFAQRFSGFLYAALSVYTVLLSVSLFAIPIILIMGKPLVAYANDTQLRWLIRACFANTIINRLCEFVLFIPAGYHTGQRGSRYQLWMSPYIALCLVRAFILPKWLGGQAQAFKPTGSISSALNERDPKLKKNMFRRLWVILVNYMAGFHLAFVYLTLVAVTLVTYRCFFQQSHSTRDILIALVTHAFWPPLTFIFICSSLWTPVAYAIDPPRMPDREDLLIRDAETKVAHPTAQSKKIAFGGQAAWFEFEYTFSTLYTCLIFVLSFLF